MSDEAPRLVVRRSDAPKGSKIAVRLGKDVDRTADLQALFSEGVVIEVLDVELGKKNATPFVTLGIRAPEAFRVDRGERVRNPRSGKELGKEAHVPFTVLSSAQADALTLEAVDARLAEARQAAVLLTGQKTRLQRDKSKASSQGLHRPDHPRHEEWLMLIEELDVVVEQLGLADACARQLRDTQKSKRYVLDHARQEAFHDHFVRIAQTRLSKKAYETLRAEAQALTDSVLPAA
jgi:hypothetical protein